MAALDYPVLYGSDIEGAGKDTTVSVTNGSNAVVGSSGSVFDSALQKGDDFICGGGIYVVDSIIDSRNLTITPPFAGTTNAAAPFVCKRWISHTDGRNIAYTITEYFSAQQTIPTEVQQSADDSAASAALSQKWAIQTSAEVVAGQGYGAKKYATDSAGSATLAGNFASYGYNQSIPGQPAGTYSAFHWATVAYNNAQTGLAYADNASASATLAQRWAEDTSGTDINGVGSRSAKYWSGQSQSFAGQAENHANDAEAAVSEAAAQADTATAAANQATTWATVLGLQVLDFSQDSDPSSVNDWSL